MLISISSLQWPLCTEVLFANYDEVDVGKDEDDDDGSEDDDGIEVGAGVGDIVVGGKADDDDEDVDDSGEDDAVAGVKEFNDGNGGGMDVVVRRGRWHW